MPFAVRSDRSTSALHATASRGDALNGVARRFSPNRCIHTALRRQPGNRASPCPEHCRYGTIDFAGNPGASYPRSGFSAIFPQLQGHAPRHHNGLGAELDYLRNCQVSLTIFRGPKSNDVTQLSEEGQVALGDLASTEIEPTCHYRELSASLIRVKNGNQVCASGLRGGNRARQQHYSRHQNPCNRQGDWVVGRDADEHACEKFAQEKSGRKSKGPTNRDQSGCLCHDETKYADSRRAQGKPYPHLVRTLCHRVGENPIDSNGGENDCKHREAGREQQDEPSLGNEVRNPLIHRLDIEHWLPCIDGSHSMAHRVGQQRRVSPLCGPAVAKADPVLDWNVICSDCATRCL